MKIRYEAEDGKIFDTETECVQYEMEKLKVMEDTKDFVGRVKSFCEQFYEKCEGCPFYKKYPTYSSCMFEGSPLDWDA